MSRGPALALALLCLAPPAAAGERLQVTFFSIGEPAPFWDVFSAAALAAAADLEIDLEILNARGDHLRMIEQAREVAARPVKPDFVLINNEKGAGGRMLEAVSAAGIRALLVSNTFGPAETRQYGRPRERLPTWLGTLNPDHEQAGHDIARALVLAAEGRFSKPIRLLAISGAKATTAATERDRGLRRALSGSPDVALAQLVHSQWNRDKARRQLAGLLRRWPDTRLVWAANDPMALGALDAVVARGGKPGRDVLIGGLNWSVDALRLVRSGELVTSVGGHFLGGAWALVLLRDYADGLDFRTEGLDLCFRMGVIDRSNVDAYLRHFEDERWEKIDFSRFSKSRNPGLARYGFTLERVLDQFP